KISAECIVDCCGLMQNFYHDVQFNISFRDVAIKTQTFMSSFSMLTR
ncbi:unnamed protein product, partial [marine sediment metagenome]